MNVEKQQKKKKKNSKWIKKRHRIVTRIAQIVLAPYAKWKYGIQMEPFREQEERPYLVLMNHQTVFDQFFVGMSFKGPIYYVATEDIFSNGFISSIIRWLVAPIPIKKQTTDITAVMNCFRVAKEGGTIAIAPEGNRTYSGKTEYMNPAIAGLAKKLKLPVILYRIEGGYGVQPRWSDGTRKGKMRSYVSRVILPEEYEGWTNEALAAVIEEGLFVNEGVAEGIFQSAKRAEYLERAMYVCPFCGLSVFESHGNEIECKKCHRKIHYGEDKTLTGVGFDFPFSFVTEWYEYQKAQVNALDVRKYTETPLYEDEASLSEVIINKRKRKLLKSAEIKLYGNRVVMNEALESEKMFLFDEVSAVSVLGRNKLNIYHEKQVYQIKGSKRFNALKYVNLYYRYKNITRGESDGKFLGL